MCKREMQVVAVLLLDQAVDKTWLLVVIVDWIRDKTVLLVVVLALIRDIPVMVILEGRVRAQTVLGVVVVILLLDRVSRDMSMPVAELEGWARNKG